jgi:hypothetical protein
MGWGDDIMLTAEARAVKKALGVPAKVCYWSPIFDGNKDITMGRGFPLENKPGKRPYHLGAVKVGGHTKVIFNPHYKAVPGHIQVGPVSHGKILIEPNCKKYFFKDNKDWGFEKYQAVVDRMDAEFLQVGAEGKVLERVEFVRTKSFMDALPYLAGAKMYLGPEGGLHHAAAALGIPGVVIFGGLTHPRTTGYDIHINLHSYDAGCGHMFDCEHCRRAMDAISVEEVIEACRAVH